MSNKCITLSSGLPPKKKIYRIFATKALNGIQRKVPHPLAPNTEPLSFLRMQPYVSVVEAFHT